MRNLIDLRKSTGLSQRDFAYKVGIPAPTYAHYESGRNEPSVDTLIKIANFFGCSIDYLLGHQTKGIIHLDSYTPIQQEVISKIQLLDEDQLYVLSKYIDTINGKPLAELLDDAKRPN